MNFGGLRWSAIKKMLNHPLNLPPDEMTQHTDDSKSANSQNWKRRRIITAPHPKAWLAVLYDLCYCLEVPACFFDPHDIVDLRQSNRGLWQHVGHRATR